MLYAEVAKIYSKNESSVREMLKKQQGTCASFAVPSQTAKAVATMQDPFLVKMEKALNLYNRYLERERDHMHITFITAYCYNCSILLLVIVVPLLLCLA